MRDLCRPGLNDLRIDLRTTSVVGSCILHATDLIASSTGV